MPRHMLKLLVLLGVVTITPATANPRIGPAPDHHASSCPYERAKLAAAAKAAHARKSETKVTLGGGASYGRWLFGLLDTPRDLTP